MRKTPIPRQVPLTHHTRLRRMSAKQAATERLRMKLRAEMLAEDPMCRRCRTRRAGLMHERKKRSRGGRLDRINCVLLCPFPCNDLTLAEPLQMGAEGWLVSAYVNPAVVPVLVAGVGRVFLAADGRMVPTSAREAS
jgi:hypothetical protein